MALDEGGGIACHKLLSEVTLAPCTDLHHCLSWQVSDEGGGIPRSGLPKMWTYLYTTAKSPLDGMDRSSATEGSDGPSVLAG